MSRIYFNAVFGALGGLTGWLLLGVLCDPTSTAMQQILLRGAIVGGSIGYFVVSVESLRDRSLLRFVRLATYGVVLGTIGGTFGILVGDQVNDFLVRRLGSPRGSTGALLGTMFARGLGWTLLGVAIGFSEGVAARSLGKLSYGTLGGALGGFIGGVCWP